MHRALAGVATLRPHLDRAPGALGIDGRVLVGGGRATGLGVTVGVVDADFDLGHPAFGTLPGRGRVAGLYEARRGVWTEGEALEALRPTPRDPSGHGTFIASLAAGSAWGSPPRAGIAPEATLVLVGAAAEPGEAAVREDDVIAGVTAVFARAEARGEPAVVVVSVGSHRGGHDGQSTLEQALGALTQHGESPGRVIVTSAGNDGERWVHARGMARGVDEGLALPLRVHEAPAEGPHDVIGLTVRGPREGAVALQWPDGAQTPWVEPGQTVGAVHPRGRGYTSLQVTRGEHSLDAEILVVRGATLGHPRMGGTYALRVRGTGPVDAWIHAPGSIPEEAQRPRFLPPYATPDGTVTLPATSRSVVAVGASVHRSGTGEEGPGLGSMATFSSRGPDAWGSLRPDLVAPGAPVLGALSRAARDAPTRSVFGDDAGFSADRTAVAAHGSSAAAALTAGAFALLLQAHPRASQRTLLEALTATARPLPPGPSPVGPDVHQGFGAIDLGAAFTALQGTPGRPPSPARSRCGPGPEAVAPAVRWEIRCVLRDPDDHPAAVDAVRLETSPGLRVLESHPGLGQIRWTLQAEAPVGTEVTARALTPAAEIARWTARIVHDPATPDAVDPPEEAGCTVGRGPRSASGWARWVSVGWGLLCWARRGRRRSSARGSGGRGRSPCPRG